MARSRPVPVLGSGDPGQGLLLGERRRVGRFWTMGFEPVLSLGRPCDLPGLCCEHVSVCVVVPLVLPPCQPRWAPVRMELSRWVGRAIGLDVHRDFRVVAICEEGRVRFGARVPSTPEGLTVFAQSLLETDRVALEVTGSCWEVARILAPHVDRSSWSARMTPGSRARARRPTG